MRRLFLVCTALALAACGGDSTGPSAPYRVQGRWRLSAALNDAQIACDLVQTMDLNQSASAFVGAYAGRVSCLAANGQSAETSGSGVIANGAVTGNAIRFDNDNQNFHFVGNGTNAGLSGTATFIVPVPGVGTHTLRGNWSAVLIAP